MPMQRSKRKGYCECHGSIADVWLYSWGTVSGARSYCAPCWRSLGLVANAEYPSEPSARSLAASKSIFDDYVLDLDTGRVHNIAP